jgi:hypothetical protein
MSIANFFPPPPLPKAGIQNETDFIEVAVRRFLIDVRRRTHNSNKFKFPY